MAMYCFCHCFLYPRTECIMKYGAVRKFYPDYFMYFRSSLDVFPQNSLLQFFYGKKSFLCYSTYQFKWWIVHSLVSFWPKNGTKLVADYSTDLALFIFAANDQCYPRIPLYPSSGTSMLPRAIAGQRNTPRWTAFC